MANVLITVASVPVTLFHDRSRDLSWNIAFTTHQHAEDYQPVLPNRCNNGQYDVRQLGQRRQR